MNARYTPRSAHLRILGNPSAALRVVLSTVEGRPKHADQIVRRTEVSTYPLERLTRYLLRRCVRRLR